jgi:hypothetical protein
VGFPESLDIVALRILVATISDVIMLWELFIVCLNLFPFRHIGILLPNRSPTDTVQFTPKSLG